MILRLIQRFSLLLTLVMASGPFLTKIVFAQQTFTNPILKSQDPWITFVGGVYYSSYTGLYGCASEHICIKASPTLTGLDAATAVDIWSAPTDATAPNYNDVWAPQIEYVSNHWYVYYAADDGGQAGVTSGNNNHHRLFVLQSKTDSPNGPYMEATTGFPHGQLHMSPDTWAIDPDVFKAADGNLYITYSCTNSVGAAQPQRICLAPMSDALTVSGGMTYLSTPNQPWENRGTDAGIQEGPVGYAWGKDTYITYSASASWFYNTYNTGILAHYNDDDSNPSLTGGSWIKYGPILDNHGSSYGNGSVVFVPSVDGSQYWAIYHSHETTPYDSFGALNTRMQPVFFTPYGYPVIGYPVNREVSLTDPAGEHGAPAGSYSLPLWGAAYGDAAEGNTTAGNVVGEWTYSSDTPGEANATSSISGVWNQVFRAWNPNVQNFSFFADVQWIADTGNPADYPKYGVYCSYDDVNNHAELFIDKINRVLASHAVVGGADQGWQNVNLPSSFDATQRHTLECDKNGSTYTFTLDPGSSSKITYQRVFNLLNGQNGIITDDTQAIFHNVYTNQFLTSK